MSELRLTLGWVARAVGGRLVAGDAVAGDVGRDPRSGPGGDLAERLIGEVVTDSRAVQQGDLFVALRGPRFDGHAFVRDVAALGAAGVVVEKDASAELSEPAVFQQLGGSAVIEVGDTLRALQELAHAVRKEAGSRVVAITGSAGKTTTKEAIAELLATRARVVKNKGNLNNHIGLPLSLLQLRTRPDVAVMELGMNHAGEISTLVAIAEPDVRVWTNVGDAHLGFFASPEAIADAKAEILEGATPASTLVANADDPRVMRRIGRFVGRTLTFGIAAGATVRASDIEDRGIDGMAALVTTPAGAARMTTPLLGRGNLSNVLAATAVAIDAGVPLDVVAEVASRLKPADRRGDVRRLPNGIVVIDDSYNSSPAALARALDVVEADTLATRKVAVLGEMLELGEHATALHEDSGRAAAAAGVQALYTIGGPAARAMAAAARMAGMPASNVWHFDTSDEAARVVAQAVRPGDLLLVKGSRGTRTDLVVDRVVAEHG